MFRNHQDSLNVAGSLRPLPNRYAMSAAAIPQCHCCARITCLIRNRFATAASRFLPSHDAFPMSVRADKVSRRKCMPPGP